MAQGAKQRTAAKGQSASHPLQKLVTGELISNALFPKSRVRLLQPTPPEWLHVVAVLKSDDMPVFNQYFRCSIAR